VVAVDSPRKRRPRLLARQDTLDISTLQNLSGIGIEDIDVDTKEGEGGRTGFSRGHTGNRSDVDRTGLGHPVGVDDGGFASTDIVVVPVPSFRVDGFTDGSNDSQSRQVVLLDKVLAESSQESNGL